MKKIVTVMLLICLVFGVAGCKSEETKKEPLTENEIKVAQNIKHFKSKLFNPEALQIHEIRFDEKETFDVYIDYSGENRMGGMNRAIILYSDGEYAGKNTSDSLDIGEKSADDLAKDMYMALIDVGWELAHENVIDIDRVTDEELIKDIK